MSESENPKENLNRETKIDFSKVVELPNGLKVINCTPHPIIFRDQGKDTLVESSGGTLSAKANEEVVGTKGKISFVRTVFESTEEGLQELQKIKDYDPNLTIIGSIISAQAYPGQVCAMTPAEGLERAPIEQRRMNPNKFTLYPVPLKPSPDISHNMN